MAIAIDNIIKSITAAKFNGTNLTKIYCDNVLVWSAFKDMQYSGQFTENLSIQSYFSNGITLNLTTSSGTQQDVLDSYTYKLTWNFRVTTNSAISTNFKITPSIIGSAGTVVFDTVSIGNYPANSAGNKTFESQTNSSIWLGNSTSLTLKFSFSGSTTGTNYCRFNSSTNAQILTITQ